MRKKKLLQYFHASHCATNQDIFLQPPFPSTAMPTTMGRGVGITKIRSDWRQTVLCLMLGLLLGGVSMSGFILSCPEPYEWEKKLTPALNFTSKTENEDRLECRRGKNICDPCKKKKSISKHFLPCPSLWDTLQEGEGDKQWTQG